jgi:hypothetical protein
LHKSPEEGDAGVHGNVGMLMQNCGIGNVVGVSLPGITAPEVLLSKVTSQQIKIFLDLGQKHL